MKEITESLDFVSYWIQSHLQQQHLLASGASEVQLNNLEDTLGVLLHADLREVLQQHNGQQSWGRPFHDGRDICGLLSVEKIKENVQRRKQYVKELIAEGGYEQTALREDLVPVFEFSTGDYWCMDMATGEMYFHDHDEPGVWHCKSVRYLLSQFVRRIEIGRMYVVGETYKRPDIQILDEIWKQLDEYLPGQLKPEGDNWRNKKNQAEVKAFEYAIQTHFALPELPYLTDYARSQALLHNGQTDAAPLFEYEGNRYRYLSMAESTACFANSSPTLFRPWEKPVFPLFESNRFLICMEVYQKHFQRTVYRIKKINESHIIMDDTLEDFLVICHNNLVISQQK